MNGGDGPSGIGEGRSLRRTRRGLAEHVAAIPGWRVELRAADDVREKLVRGECDVGRVGQLDYGSEQCDARPLAGEGEDRWDVATVEPIAVGSAQESA